jgi:predicted nucleotidyltransferase
MTPISFYVQIINALDEIGAPYMIVGAFGGYAFGLTRTTYDIDILVDLQEPDFEALSKRFPLPRYYADPEMMRNSVQMGIMFNLIDTDEGIKADLVPLKREPENRIAFERRVRREFIDPAGNVFLAWVAQPSDIIIGKLYAWNEGKSDKHPKDIYAMLIFDLSGNSDIPVDYKMVTKEAAHIGQETLDMWNNTLARAKEEVQKGSTPRKW